LTLKSALHILLNREETMSQKKEWGKKRAEKFAKTAMGNVYEAMAKRITTGWKCPGDGATFLDLGTGPGFLLVEVRKLFPGAKVIGVDPSEDMLAIARCNAETSGLPGIEIKAGKAEDIPVDSASVDLLMAQFVLHEWHDVEKGFSEITRVLKPGGMVVIRAWNKSCPRWKFWKHNIEHLFKFGWHRALEARRSRRRSYPFAMVVDHVRRHNLAPVEIEEDVVLFIKARKSS
jgi:ubiquinone/menaquinone biosynthesis C-methylase UbiE